MLELKPSATPSLPPRPVPLEDEGPVLSMWQEWERMLLREQEQLDTEVPTPHTRIVERQNKRRQYMGCWLLVRAGATIELTEKGRVSSSQAALQTRPDPCLALQMNARAFLAAVALCLLSKEKTAALHEAVSILEGMRMQFAEKPSGARPHLRVYAWIKGTAENSGLDAWLAAQPTCAVARL